MKHFVPLALLSLFLFSPVLAEQKDDEHCAVIFGAAVWKDDKPSHALYDRIAAGIDLYKDGEVNCFVFSGGASTYGAHEVDVMQKISLEAGVPDTVFYLDYEGNSTEETMRNLPPQVEKFTFVSNDFHMKRIDILAKKLGVEDYELHAAKYNAGRYEKEEWFKFREFGGRIYTWLFVW